MRPIFILILSLLFLARDGYGQRTDFYQTVTARNAILEDTPIPGFPIISFQSLALANHPVSYNLYPSLATPYPPASTPQPHYSSHLFNAIRNFFSGKTARVSSRRTSPKRRPPRWPGGHLRHFSQTQKSPPTAPPSPVVQKKIEKIQTATVATVSAARKAMIELDTFIRTKEKSPPHPYYGTDADRIKLEKKSEKQRQKVLKAAEQVERVLTDLGDAVGPDKLVTTTGGSRTRPNNKPPPHKSELDTKPLQAARETPISPLQAAKDIARKEAELAEDYRNAIRVAIRNYRPPPLSSPPSEASKTAVPLSPMKPKKVAAWVGEGLQQMESPNKPGETSPCNHSVPSTSLDEDHPTRWNKGCRSLESRPIGEDEVDVLFDQCLASLRDKILVNRSSDKIDRKTLFGNMLDERQINPREQHFLALIFTSFGETRKWSKNSEKWSPRQERQRYRNVMRVIDNRTDHIRKRYGDKTLNTTGMDIVLSRWQFTVYNPGDPNLSKMINYDAVSTRKESMKNAVRAYIEYENNNRHVPPMDDKVRHYVTHDFYKKKCIGTNHWCAGGGADHSIKDPHHVFLKGAALENFAPPFENRWGD